MIKKKAKRRRANGYALKVAHREGPDHYVNKMVGRAYHNDDGVFVLEHEHLASQRHDATESPGGFDSHVMGVLCSKAMNLGPHGDVVGPEFEVEIWDIEDEDGKKTFRKITLFNFLRNAIYNIYDHRHRLFVPYAHYERFDPGAGYESPFLPKEWVVPIVFDETLWHYLRNHSIAIMGLPEPPEYAKHHPE